MLRPTHTLIAAGVLIGALPSGAHAQHKHSVPAVSVSGEGPQTVVLLTGLLGGVAGFRRLQARLLAQQQRVVIIDSYRLSIDSADVSFAAQARRVDRVLDSLRVTSAKVVGHGHGAGVALRLAASSPQRVTALYLLDVGGLPDHRSPIFASSLRLVPLVTRLPGGRSFARRRFVRGLHESGGPNAWLDAATERSYTEPLFDEIDRVIALAIRLGRANEPEPLPTVIARIRVPVTVLLGGAPHTAGPDSGELAALEPLGSLVRVETIAGVGHFPHEEAPDETARYVLEARREVLAIAPQGAP
jgi:pimeloyl-ACP methyl ester carboxylesterase